MHCFTAKDLKTDIYLVRGEIFSPEFFFNMAVDTVHVLSYSNIFNISGEQARSLFIRSKLPLPELSKIWFV